MNPIRVLFLSLALLFSLPAHSVSSSKPCGEVHCAGPQIGPWQYYLSRYNLGRFPTQQMLAEVFENHFDSVVAGCYINITQPDWDDWIYEEDGVRYTSRPEWNGNMRFKFDIPYEYTAYSRPFEYTYTAHSWEPACSSIVESSIVWTKERSIKCPSGFTEQRDGTIEGVPYRCAKDLEGRIEITNLGPTPFNGVRVDGQCTSRDNIDELVGNPINVTNANKYQVESDYRGSGRFPLVFERHYNSFPAFHLPRYYPEAESSNLGPGWRHTYSRRIAYEQTLNATAYLHRPEGRAYLFVESGNEFTPLTASEFTLTREQDENGATLGWRVVGGAGEVESYNAQGQLVSITNAEGETQTLTYENNLLTTVTDAAGRSLTLTYNGSHDIYKVIDPAGNEYSYAYNSYGVLASVTKPGNAVRSYLYNSDWRHLLTQITDENGNVFASFVYDFSTTVGSRGKALSTEHAGGVGRFQVSYPNATTTQVTTPTGAALTYTHAAVKGLSNVTQVQSGKGSRSETFTPDGLLASRTDETGVTTTFTYDAAGYEVSRTEGYGTADAVTTTTAWHPDFRKITQIQRGDRTENYGYDGEGRLTSISVTDGVASRTTSLSYDTAGRLISVDGPRTDVSDVTALTYHPDGTLATVTNAAGHVTQFTEYDAHGNWVEMVEPTGVITAREFDARNRLSWSSRGGETTAYAYSPAGDLTAIANPDGTTQTFVYDAARRLTRINASDGSYLLLTLDNAGNVTQRRAYRADGTQIFGEQQVFDLYGRLIKQSSAYGHERQFAYDAADNLISTTSPLAATSTFTRDALKRITRVIDPENGTTDYAYDPLHQLVSVTDPRGVTTTFARTALGDLLMEVSPDRGQTVNAVDAAGNILSQTDANGNTTTYAYDALNRLVAVSYEDGAAVQFGYDAGNGIGKLTSMTDSTGVTQWGYDAKGRLTSRTQTTGLVTLAEAFSYNAAGQLATYTLPSGTALGYSYDAAGRVAEVTANGTSVASAIAYDPFGRVAQWTAGNGQPQSRTYDLDGRLIGYTLDTGTQTVSYDAAGRVTGVGSSQYVYDDLDQVTQYTGVLGSFLYDYDAAGNRLSAQANGQAFAYSTAPSSNRVLSVTGGASRSFSYDAAGNILSDGTATHVYNAANRRVQTLQGADQVDYRYNGLGQRVQKFGSSVPTRHYLYNADGSLVGEYTDSGAPVLELVKLGDLPVAVLTPAGTLYAQADHLSTVRALQNAAGVTVWRWESDPFGAVQPEQDPDGNGIATVFTLRFPGQYYDAETGTHYNYHRDYDPAMGRYTQADPLGVAGGLNVYAYVGNDPVRMVDPLGLRYSPYEHGMDWDGKPVANPRVSSSFGISASGALLFTTGNIDTGIAVDTLGAICGYFTSCVGIGVNTPVAGELGAAVSVGVGQLCSGTKQMSGVYWAGGAGLVGQGQIFNDASFARALFGIGGSPEGVFAGAGAMKCQTTYRCINQSSLCTK